MTRTLTTVLAVAVTACGGSIRGEDDYQDGVAAAHDGAQEARLGVELLEADLSSQKGRDQVDLGFVRMDRGVAMVQDGLDQMGSVWGNSRGCHGHPDDVAMPLRDDLAEMNDARAGMNDADMTDDGLHLERLDDALHEFQHHVDRMELEMECIRHHD